MRNFYTLRVITVFVLIFFIATIGGIVSGCQKVEEEKETPRERQKVTDRGEEVEFENPDLLVSTEWLERHLSDKELKTVDVRAEGDYSGGHIKGALNLPIEKTIDADNPVQSMVVPKQKIENLLGNLGISNSSKIVVYDSGGTPFAGRVFWILKYYGHKDVSLLDGGIKKWQKEGKKLKWETTEVEKTNYKAKVNPDINTTKAEVKKWIEKKDKDVVLVDTRPQKEWDAGHFPGAVRLDWVELSTADDPPVLKSAKELQEIFDDAGITKDIEVVLY